MRTLSRYLPHFSVDDTLRPSGFEGREQKAHPAAEGLSHGAPQVQQAPTFSQEEVNLAVSQAVREATAKAKAELAASEAARREDEERFQDTMNERLAIARAEWSETESDRLASAMTEAFGALEKRIGDVLARILTPFVAVSMRDRAIEEAKRSIEDLLNQPLPANSALPVITIRGPQDLLSLLRERLGEPEGIEFCPTQEIEIEVTCADTLIETRLGAWSRRLTAAQDQAESETEHDSVRESGANG